MLMKDNALKTILNTIKEHDLIEKGDSVLIGVSGGADSITLLHLLHSQKDELGITIAALHVNHQLRGREADEDEQFVADFCDKRGISLFCVRSDVARHAAGQRISVEEAGREERYRIFEENAVSGGFDKVALGHNLDDQAETVLLNLIRGTGPDGLCGMPYKRGRIIRPLLDTRRSAIEEYCRISSIEPKTDSSNLSRKYSRNRVRLDLIPYIDGMFGADIVERLCSMSRLAREDRDFLDGAAAEGAGAAVAADDSGRNICIDIDALLKLHPSISKRVIRIAIMKAAGTLKGVAGSHISAVAGLARRGRTGSVTRIPVGVGVFARVSYGRLLISSAEVRHVMDKPTAAFRLSTSAASSVAATAALSSASLSASLSSASAPLHLPGITEAAAFNISLVASLEAVRPDPGFYKAVRQGAYEQFFDYHLLAGGINRNNNDQIDSDQINNNDMCLIPDVRSRKQGDVFKPFGSKFTKRLKEYLIDEKIPREDRDFLPLVAYGNEIVWMIGRRTSDKFKVTENTKIVLRLKARPVPGAKAAAEATAETAVEAAVEAVTEAANEAEAESEATAEKWIRVDRGSDEQ